MSDLGSKTLVMKDYGTESIQVPQQGLMVDFSQLPQDLSKKYTCTLTFQIPQGSTLYMQNAGSAGAEVSNWIGPDHAGQSGSVGVSFDVKRTSDGGASPLFIYAINVHDPDRNNVYKEFKIDFDYTSSPA